MPVTTKAGKSYAYRNSLTPEIRNSEFVTQASDHNSKLTRVPAWLRILVRANLHHPINIGL